MSSYTDGNFWGVIIALAIGCFLMRFSFLGMVGNRPMPEWLLRHLRYTGVAILPTIAVPLSVWPVSTGGTFSAPHLAVACVALAIGTLTRNVLATMAAGATAYLLLLVLV